jgi:hypothetical protein
MTLHSYLINKKTPATVLAGDEAPAEHIGMFDAAVAISGAESVTLYGDAKQVEWDPYVAGVVALHAAPGKTVPEKNYTFLAETHRNPADVCAAWLHEYPSYYPCECHSTPEKRGVTMHAERVASVSSVVIDESVRVHTYKQDEKEEVKDVLGFRGDMKALRERRHGGLATVHEDQGTTRKRVVTIRPFADYDKNRSEFNPSLHNRSNYVLSDTTRHTESYHYYSVCAENDGIFKAVERSKDPARLALVAARKGLAPVALQSMWA